MSTGASGVGFDNYSLKESLTTWTTTGVENAADDEGGEGYSLIEKTVVGIVLAILVLTAFAGNLLVAIVIIMDRRLKRRNSNLFLMSLAFTDMLMALLVMTFGLINDVLGRWEFGTKFCLIWICFDITCSTASILNLCLICIDRYMQIARPMHYETWMTKRKIDLLIVMAWLISIMFAFVPLQLGWHMPPPDQRIPADPHICILGFSFIYAVVTSSISFYIPCIVILILNLRSFLLTRAHIKHMSKHTIQLEIYTEENLSRSVCVEEGTSPSMLRAVTTIGVIVGVFLICWLPFSIISPIAAKCATCVTPLMFQVFTWMGWANSCANPFIYSLLNRDFRAAFRRKLLKTAESMTSRNDLSNYKAKGSRTGTNPQSSLAQNSRVNNANNTWKLLAMPDGETKHQEPKTVLGSLTDSGESDDFIPTIQSEVHNAEMKQGPTVSSLAPNSRVNNADNTLKLLPMQEGKTKHQEPKTVLGSLVDSNDFTSPLHNSLRCNMQR